jgi:hypothetical protein
MKSAEYSPTWCAVPSPSAAKPLTRHAGRGVDDQPRGQIHPVTSLTSGAVTAEWALTLPSVGLALALALGGISLGVERGRLHQAASDGQRLLSYGASTADISAHVQSVLRSSAVEVTVLDGPAEHTGCVRVQKTDASWITTLLPVDRDAHSCGLIVPR